MKSLYLQLLKNNPFTGGLKSYLPFKLISAVICKIPIPII